MSVNVLPESVPASTVILLLKQRKACSAKHIGSWVAHNTRSAVDQSAFVQVAQAAVIPSSRSTVCDSRLMHVPICRRPQTQLQGTDKVHDHQQIDPQPS